MATSKPAGKSIDVLLYNHESEKAEYIELEKGFRTNGSDAIINTAFDQVKKNLDAGTTTPVHGVEYTETKAGSVGITRIEIEGADAAVLKDGQAWLDDLGESWAQANNWKKNPTSGRQGYTAYSLQPKK